MQHSACAAKHAANSPSRLAAWTLEVALGQDRSYRKALNGIEEDVDLRIRCDEVTMQLQRAKNHVEYSLTARCSKGQEVLQAERSNIVAIIHGPPSCAPGPGPANAPVPDPLPAFAADPYKKRYFRRLSTVLHHFFMSCSCLLCLPVYCFYLICSVNFTWQSPQISQTNVLWRPLGEAQEAGTRPVRTCTSSTKGNTNTPETTGHPDVPCGAFHKTIFVSTEACVAGGLLNAIGKMRSEAVSVTPQRSRREKNMQC